MAYFIEKVYFYAYYFTICRETVIYTDEFMGGGSMKSTILFSYGNLVWIFLFCISDVRGKGGWNIASVCPS